MSSLDKYPLNQAQQAFAVANTPLFLVRKLRTDPEVHDIARALEGPELLDLLRASLASTPPSLRETVIPYVLLVSLSFKDDASFLKAALSIPRGYENDWFDYVLQALLQTYRPTAFSTVSPIAGTRIVVSSATKTNAAANRLIIKAS